MTSCHPDTSHVRHMTLTLHYDKLSHVAQSLVVRIIVTLVT